jgi:succinate dehydrogenase/fumarate reductase flavoprotein subunit
MGTAGAALLATAGVVGCAPQSEQVADGAVTSGGKIPETWDRETEILVVGGGGGGMIAACNNWYTTATARRQEVSMLEYETLEELAKAMEVPAGTLKAAIDRYNSFVSAGSDEDFGRLLRQVEQLNTPPFRAIRMAPRHYTTYGGIAIGAECHVLSRDDSPIPGLYAAGTCCGSSVEQEGIYYEGGVGQTLTQGCICAEVATAEQMG